MLRRSILDSPTQNTERARQYEQRHSFSPDDMDFIRAEYQRLWNLAVIIDNQYLYLARFISYEAQIDYANRIKPCGRKFKYFREMFVISKQSNHIDITETVQSLSFLHGELKGLALTIDSCLIEFGLPGLDGALSD